MRTEQAEIDRLKAELTRVIREREAAREELNRVKAKLGRVKREVRNQMGASQYRDEIERSRALAEQEPCELCPQGQIRRKSIHRIITNSTVHYWCSAHADEHYRHRLAALAEAE